jgi:hypothetical protein
VCSPPVFVNLSERISEPFLLNVEFGSYLPNIALRYFSLRSNTVEIQYLKKEGLSTTLLLLLLLLIIIILFLPV